MATYSHILLSVDLAPVENDLIVSRALAMSRLMNAKLSIVHVIEPIYYYGTLPEAAALIDTQADQKQLAEETFIKLCNSIHIPEANRHLLIGSAKHLILETADKIQADLIIMGSHGRHGLDLVLLGSTASAILHHAKCDVLAIRVGSKE